MKSISQRRGPLSLALIILCGTLMTAAMSSATVQLYTDIACWRAAIEGEEALTTIPSNITLANEVTSDPGNNAQLGSTLTFESVNTGLSRTFRVTTLQPGAGFTYSDCEGSCPASFRLALSPGDIDNYENDDWQVEVLGSTMSAFGFEMRDNHSNAGEWIRLVAADGTILATISTESTTPLTGFIGIVADFPFAKVMYNEDVGGDDIAIADFRFAEWDATTPSSRLFTDLAAWQAEIGEDEVLVTDAFNVALADEVLYAPSTNMRLGPTLTFRSVNTGLSHSFQVSTLQPGAEWTYNDCGPAGCPAPNFSLALSVGDIDYHANDDWEIVLLGTETTAIGFEMRDNYVRVGESITLLDADDNVVDYICAGTTPFNGFIGVITEVPFCKFRYDEDSGIDDTAIADFRFLNSGVDLGGEVVSDCDGPLAGVAVELRVIGGETFSTVTAEDGSYLFQDLTRGLDYEVSVDLQANQVALAPENGTFSFPGLAADTVADFALGCLFDLTGTVSSDCLGAMAGITVTLDDGEDYPSVLTAEDGTFLFEDLPYESAAELTCVLPLGFHPTSPEDGHTFLTITQDESVDFQLGCVPTTGTARGMGYWKHQANVYIKGRGNADESQDDMETNFPASVFNHFHENDLNSIAVEGVTYMGEGVPLDLATIQATLTVKGGQYMLDRAKQHYLSLLLNLASGKIHTFTVVSADGRTASEALQYVAFLINDGIEENDQHSIQISESMNEAIMLGAGMIPEEYTYIAYRPGMGVLPRTVELAQNAPNPFNPMTKIAFALPSEQRVRIGIYAVNGRRVATLLDEVVSQGRHEVIWTGEDDRGRPVASGAYFYRLDAGKFSETRSMVLLK